MYQIDLLTGVASDLGLVNFGDAEGLSFVGSTLYAIGGSVHELWDITTPPGVKVGNTGARNGIDAGLAYNSVDKKMYNIQGSSGASDLYGINTATGAATLVGSSTAFADGLAIDATGTAYAIDGIFSDSLYTVNLGTGAMTLVGPLGLGDLSVQFGLSFDPIGGALYGLSSTGDIITLNTTTGGATLVATTLTGFEGLAIPGGTGGPVIPAPGAVLLGSLGVGLVGWLRRRRAL